MAQRLKEITYLRAFAALSIMLIHVTSGYIKSGYFGYAINQFPRYGSPVFIIISGFILYHIETIRPSPSYMHFFTHRFLKLFIPYSLWTIVYSTFTMGSRFGAGESLDVLLILRTYLTNILTGSGYVHLYFVLIMIQLYALFPFLKKRMEKNPQIILVGATLVSFLSQALIYLHRLNIIYLPTLDIAYAALFPGWLAFFCLGIYLKINLKQTMDFWQKRKNFLKVIWVCLLIITIIEGWLSQINITLRPTVSMFGVATFFLFYLIFENLKNTIYKPTDQLIEWIANNSFQIYLAHPLILTLLTVTFSWKGYLGMATFYVSAVLVTGLFIYLLNRTKDALKNLQPAKLEILKRS